MQAIPFFAGLEEDDYRRLHGSARTRRCESGEVVIEQGDPPEAVYAVSTGRFKVVAPREGGRDATLQILGPGDVFGELAMLDEGVRSARVTALEESVLVVVERRGFLDLHRRSRTIADRLLALVVARFRSSVEHFENTTSLDVSQRLAKRLLALAERHGELAQDGSLRMPLPRSPRDLVDLIDDTRQSVNRVLRAWAEEGLVREQDGTLRLLDPRTLRDRAGP
ncbi:MAG: Crp/Fnr family transcriptional regulator [Myxococcales bacterium]|nr:Crp/Fnr family transcriptional regulator [Myxococcales bacterium]